MLAEISQQALVAHDASPEHHLGNVPTGGTANTQKNTNNSVCHRAKNKTSHTRQIGHGAIAVCVHILAPTCYTHNAIQQHGLKTCRATNGLRT